MDPDIFLTPDVVFDYVTLFELNIHLPSLSSALLSAKQSLILMRLLWKPQVKAVIAAVSASRTACVLPGIIVSAAA
jgi:hypothetical protein